MLFCIESVTLDLQGGRANQACGLSQHHSSCLPIGHHGLFVLTQMCLRAQLPLQNADAGLR